MLDFTKLAIDGFLSRVVKSPTAPTVRPEFAWTESLDRRLRELWLRGDNPAFIRRELWKSRNRRPIEEVKERATFLGLPPYAPATRPTAWTSEQDDRLRALVADGKSSKQIAERIGKTRSAVTGRAHRLGLVLRGGNKAPKIDKRPVRPQRTPRPVLKSAPFALGTKPIAQIAEVAAVNVVTVGIPIERLRRDSCRWPLWADEPGDESKLYCGRLTTDERSWCRGHGLAATARLERSMT